MATIALIGPGAIGGTIAAWLAQDPAHAVTLGARTPVDALAVETPTGALHARLPTLIAGATVAVDWILIATKAYATAATAAWLPALRGPATRIAILQNGVEQLARFAPYAPAAQLVPVVVEGSAERLAPGRIHQRSPMKLTVPAGANGAAFAALFAATPIAVEPTADFVSAAWRKLCVNCAGAVSALADEPARVVERPEHAERMRGLIRECIAVGRAEGATLPDELVEAIVARQRRAAPDAVNSLLADRRAGRPLELDARNGVIVRRGAVHGIATPLNQAIIADLRAALDAG